MRPSAWCRSGPCPRRRKPVPHGLGSEPARPATEHPERSDDVLGGGGSGMRSRAGCKSFVPDSSRAPGQALPGTRWPHGQVRDLPSAGGQHRPRAGLVRGLHPGRHAGRQDPRRLPPTPAPGNDSACRQRRLEPRTVLVAADAPMPAVSRSGRSGTAACGRTPMGGWSVEVSSLRPSSGITIRCPPIAWPTGFVLHRARPGIRPSPTPRGRNTASRTWPCFTRRARSIASSARTGTSNTTACKVPGAARPSVVGDEGREVLPAGHDAITLIRATGLAAGQRLPPPRPP